MADLSTVIIKAPLGTYRSDRTERESLAELEKTKTNAGALIKKIAGIHHLPLSYAFSVACVETLGNSIRSQDGVSYGIMQCNAATLDGVIKFAISSNMSIGQFKHIYYVIKEVFTIKKNAVLPPLVWPELNLNGESGISTGFNEWAKETQKRIIIDSQPVKEVLSYSKPNSILTKGGGYSSPTNVWNMKMISDKEFGLHVGFLYLYDLITKSLVAEGTKQYIRTDWVINGYNAGYFRKENPWINSMQRSMSPDKWLGQSTIPAITRNYVRRISGVGGYLELIKKDKFVLP